MANILIDYFVGGTTWTKSIKDDKNMFKQVQAFKLKQTPENMCYREASCLLPFVKEIHSYAFHDEPNYAKLKQMLRCVLLDQNIAPSLKFDWSKFSSRNKN